MDREGYGIRDRTVRRDLERGMPVDMDHAMDRHKEAEAPAAGWIEELAARDDGIWARIAWTPTGKAKITGREYRFISPVVMVTKAGEVMAVKRAGLTNAPAIAMKALCSVEDDPRQPDPPADDAASVVAMLREALGAAPATPIPDLIRKARAIIAAADGTKTDNRAAKEMASSNLASFEAWEACARPAVNLGSPMLAGRKPPPELLECGRFRGSNERMAICSQLGLDPEQIEEKE